MSNPVSILDANVRCKTLSAHDTKPPSQNARLQVGDVITNYIDLSLRGELCGKIQPGKNYRIRIEEIESAD